MAKETERSVPEEAEVAAVRRKLAHLLAIGAVRVGTKRVEAPPGLEAPRTGAREGDGERPDPAGTG